MFDDAPPLLPVLGVAALLVSAGCAGAPFDGLLGGQSTPTGNGAPATTPVDSDSSAAARSDVPASAGGDSPPPTSRATGDIRVTNYRYDEAFVRVVAVRGNLTAVNWTYTNGSVRTVSVADAERPAWSNPYSPRLGTNVSRVAPANATVLARWSMLAPRNGTVAFPTVDDAENASYLVVVSDSEAERVVAVRYVTCEPPHPILQEYSLQLGDPGDDGSHGSSHVGCG